MGSGDVPDEPGEARSRQWGSVGPMRLVQAGVADFMRASQRQNGLGRSPRGGETDPQVTRLTSSITTVVILCTAPDGARLAVLGVSRARRRDLEYAPAWHGSPEACAAVGAATACLTTWLGRPTEVPTDRG